MGLLSVTPADSYPATSGIVMSSSLTLPLDFTINDVG